MKPYYRLKWTRACLAGVLFWASSAFAGSAKVVIHVGLFPAGSFNIESEKVEGTGEHEGAAYFAKEFKVPVESLKTGIGLRDNHLHEKLEAKKYPFIVVKDVKAEAGKGTAKITVMDITKDINFTYKDLGEQKAQGSFKLDLSEFKVAGINYKGIGVEDVVDITATLSYETKTKTKRSK